MDTRPFAQHFRHVHRHRVAAKGRGDLHTLHHFPLDPASRQVRLALGEKRLAFVEHPVRYWERPKSLTDLNPSGSPEGVFVPP